MNTLLRWLADYGLVVAFLNVLFAQLGLPLPAYPVLIATGALAFNGMYSPAMLLAAAVVACLVADTLWYAAGGRYGGRIVRNICRISISPDSCVRQTEALFSRWGPRSLVIAKFIPGFAAVATVLAGNLRVPFLVFLGLDAIGGALWASVGIGLGMLFHGAVDRVLAVLEALGHVGLFVLAIAFALFLGVKWWQRHRLIRELRMARITVAELGEMIDKGSTPIIIDVRSDVSRRRDGAIPGAFHWLDDETGAEALPRHARDGEVVVYCACPNEISAARVAQRLRKAGFRCVRPLHGGIEAWVGSGRPVERFELALAA